jgi:hypothetical protein
VDREWIGGETRISDSRWFAAAHQHFDYSTPHLIRSPGSGQQQLPPCYNTTPKHRTLRSAASSDAHHDCCCTHPQSCCAQPKVSHHTDPIRCLAPLLAAPKPIATARPSLPPSRPPAFISPIYPAQVRLVAAACCFVPIYRGRLLPAGLSLEERGSGLFEVFEILYCSAAPQSAVL